MLRARRLVFVALLGVAGFVGVIVLVVAVDSRGSNEKVVRNVTLAGRSVGRLDRAALSRVVTEIAGKYRSTPLQVLTSTAKFTIAPGEIGLNVDESKTIAAALRVGRGGNPVGNALRWMTSFTHSRKAAVSIQVDQAAVRREVALRDPDRAAPKEPSIVVQKGSLVAVDGTPGRGVDAAQVIDALPLAARNGAPIRVRVRRGAVAPRFTLADAERLVAVGKAATAKPLGVTVDGQPADVPEAKLRSWLRSDATGPELRLVVDTARATSELAELLADLGKPATETTFTVVDNVPQVVPGAPGTACCGNGAGEKIDAALEARIKDGTTPDEPIALPVKDRAPKLTATSAARLGIKEVVGTFTTNHAPNQPRVSNIHHIADLVRGQVIQPGKTFSVNDFVGKRTLEKGFVVDHVIEDGKFTESVGGGISQFATTTFNAAFFAGLEFSEYQSHSLYISRYPFGREATLSFPHPDLKVRNPSPYGVLIWPTYTGKSLTITLFSTKWVDATQTNQTKEPRGLCTRVRTERTRKFLDGTTKVDSVTALYRPAEGVDCNDPALPPGSSSTASTTTTVPTTTTVKPTTTVPTTAVPAPATTTIAPPTSTPPVSR